MTDDDLKPARRPSLNRRRALLAVLIGVAGAIVFAAWFVPFVPKLRWGEVEVTRWIKRRGEVRERVGPGEPDWVDINKVSRHAINAIIASEDGRFYDHPGIDIVQIQKSMAENAEAGRIVRGASTITQQVIKMAFLTRDRTWLRKAREIVGSLLAEMLLSKDEILQWYVNLAEFGDSIYGIEKAAHHYFRIKPELLSLEQGVHLALVLPSPNGWSRGLRRRNLTEFGHRRFRQILSIMKISGMINDVEWRHALSQGNFGSPIDAAKDRRHASER